MKYEKLNEIKSNIDIKSTRKVISLLNGLSKSIYVGRSMDFDDLRDYVIGDNSKDIDWKSSIRHGSLLVRRYEAYRRHNILFLIDSGTKFKGYASTKDKKSDLSVFTYGTLAYLAYKKEDDTAYISNINGNINFSKFRCNLYDLETNLQEVTNNIEKESNFNINDLLNFAINNTKKKMVIMIISDIDGLSKLDMNLVARASLKHNLVYINIEDLSIFGNDRFDLDVQRNVPKIIARSKSIRDIEKKEKEKLIKSKTNDLKRYRVTVGHIEHKEEIVEKLIDLLERHNNAVGTRT